MMELISKAALDALERYRDESAFASVVNDCIDIVQFVSTVEKWMEENKEKILQAGKEGQEVEFRIGGRLFRIREVAQ